MTRTKKGGGGPSREHQMRREKNNEAVAKCRQRKRHANEVKEEQCNQLREENRRLESELENLQKQLETFKELFIKLNTPVDPNVGQRPEVQQLISLLKSGAQDSSTTSSQDLELLRILQNIQ
ncbi:unnamed protein product [Cyprideis torosa]|uniref:Uncharacterized protein n=1 Tax=Cyprideis torosa TaxID=163714 RepID=A0A7R8WGB0_9CRUS|nr:unnamed protein product [Cyprideis torosa]CAG0897952.1 unnamed protein product [Cyprideis torosa]